MKKVGIVVLVLVLIGAAIALYLYNKPHRDYTEETAAYTVTAAELMDTYQSDVQEANALYLDQVIAVSGVLIEKQSQGVVLEPGIFVSVPDSAYLSSLSEGDEVNLKGRVLGYDELLEEVKIDNASAASAQ